MNETRRLRLVRRDERPPAIPRQRPAPEARPEHPSRGLVDAWQAVKFNEDGSVTVTFPKSTAGVWLAALQRSLDTDPA